MNTPTPTGEPWTANTVGDMVVDSCGIGHTSLQAIADAHNAALAAEREAWDKQFTATMTVLGETQQQLAAAEREARQLAEHNLTRWQQAAMRDAAQLDAAVEACSLGLAYLDSLQGCSFIEGDQEYAEAHAALAKIGEGK